MSLLFVGERTIPRGVGVLPVAAVFGVTVLLVEKVSQLLSFRIDLALSLQRRETCRVAISECHKQLPSSPSAVGKVGRFGLMGIG